MVMSNFLYMIFGGYVLYGLSGSLMNSVWPEAAKDIGVQVALIGVVTTLCNIASGVAGAFTYKIRRQLGTNRTISIGLLFMAISLIMFYFAQNMIVIGTAFIILGIGNAIVDIGSNSYIVKAYDARSVSMLHACWGIGSAVGPVIMAFVIAKFTNYRIGFIVGAVLNIIIITILRFMKRKWEANKKDLSEELLDLHTVSEAEKTSKSKFTDVVKIHLALPMMICFFFANGLNGLFNSWMSTIFVTQRNISVIEGANIATIFFLSLTITRIVLGFIASKFKTQDIVIAGVIISILGTLFMFVQSKNLLFIYANAILLGIGISPIVPFLNHYIKELFGKDSVGEILSFCAVFNLTGAGISSFVGTLFVRAFGMEKIQIYIMVFAVILLLIYSYITINVKKGKGD